MCKTYSRDEEDEVATAVDRLCKAIRIQILLRNQTHISEALIQECIKLEYISQLPSG